MSSFDNQDYDGSSDLGQNANGMSNQQAGGYKATINNPNIPEHTKERAHRVLDGQEEPTDKDHGDKQTNQVLGGYKATLSNPKTGEEAKKKAENILRDNDAL